MASQVEIETGNHLKLALEQKQFFCTAELVLGRDHNVKEAETFEQYAESMQHHHPAPLT